MKNPLHLLISVALLTFSVAPTARGAESDPLGEAELHRKAALAAHEEVVFRVGLERDQLKGELEHWGVSLLNLKGEVSALQAKVDALQEVKNGLPAVQTRVEQDAEALETVLRTLGKDLREALHASPLAAVYPDQLRVDEGVATRVPTLGELGALTGTAFREMELSSRPREKDGHFVGRDGKETTGRLLTFGKFLHGYATSTEAGFLYASESTGQMIAFAALPDRSTRQALRTYLTGGNDVVPLDLSGGGGTAKFAKRSDPSDKLKEGGPLVWPIVAIGAVALFLILERFFLLLRSQVNPEKVLGRLGPSSEPTRWEDFGRTLGGDKPLTRVLSCAVQYRHEERESMESLVHEALMREARRVERFLPTLGVLGGIAPMIGLLGTVTGMISTFQAITAYGTGDPKMMAGGISEALITTMLGLSVAIPILFFHNFLSRRGHNLIDEIEEKTVWVLSMIHKDSASARGGAR